MLHFLSGESATLAVQEVVVIDPRAVALYPATIVVAALGIKGLRLEAVLRNKARLGAPKATSASIDFNDLTWRLGTATRVVDASKFKVSMTEVVTVTMVLVATVTSVSRKGLYLEDSTEDSATDETLGVVVINPRAVVLLGLLLVTVGVYLDTVVNNSKIKVSISMPTVANDSLKVLAIWNTTTRVLKSTVEFKVSATQDLGWKCFNALTDVGARIGSNIITAITATVATECLYLESSKFNVSIAVE